MADTKPHKSVELCRALALGSQHPNESVTAAGSVARHRSESSMPPGLRLGLATLVAEQPSQQGGCGTGAVICGLLPWCAAARRLLAALPRGLQDVELVVITGASNHLVKRRRGASMIECIAKQIGHGVCPASLRVVQATARMERAAKAHVQRVIAGGVMSYNPAYVRSHLVTLYKWELLRLHKYDAVLFVDLDVDLLPAHGGSNLATAAAVQREWALRLPALRGHANTHGLRIVGYGDLTSPLVLGAYWVFPPRAASQLYEDGLRVLEAPWNATHGWNRSGTPKQLWDSLPQRYADGSVITGRHGVPRPTSRANSWSKIDSGDLDQGFLLYMLYYRHAGMGAFMRGGGAHKLRHYVQGRGGKPWVHVLSAAGQPDTARVAACGWESLKLMGYLRQVPLVEKGNVSTCAARFERVRSALTTHLDVRACCESLGRRGPGGDFGNVAIGVF